MAVRIQFRRGTAAEWTSANPTLAAGELGYETDTTKFKLGDGSTAWTSLGYGGVSQSDIDNAVANVIDLAPATLDTLNELAASIGDDSDFANTVTNNINSSIATHNGETTNVHGISDTSLLETQSGAQAKANAALASAQSYTDSAVSGLVDSAPGALDTLNELAAALGDDANFSTTVTNSLATKINFEIDSQTNYASANAVTTANTLYLITGVDGTYLKVGDGSTNYNDLDVVGKGYADSAVSTHAGLDQNVHGIANTADLLVTQDLTDHAGLTENVHGIANTALLATTSDVANAKSEAQSYADGLSTNYDSAGSAANAQSTAQTFATTSIAEHSNVTTNVHGITDTSDLLVTADLTAHNDDTTSVHGIANTADLVVTADLGGASSTELGYVSGVTSAIQTQIDDLTTDVSNTYAPLSNATLTGTVSLPATTSIGDVDSTEIGYLNGVTSAVQDQLNAKLASATASSTYAPLSGPTFTGTVSLPATTSIGDVSATEIGYVNGVTSDIQTQLDAKLASATASSTYAPIVSPTFTTSATLPAQTDIGNVSATEIGYLDGVTSAIQTQIDAKAPIANATFTGTTEAVDLTLTGNLYVQGATTTISTSNLKLRDNMTYLNQAGAFDLSGASGDGTNVVYTTSSNHDYAVGDFVTVANTTPSSFDIGAGNGVEILAITDNTFTVASSNTDTYTSGGDARGKIHFNPDLGWAAGRYADNTYAHAGFFRDATDGVFKVFDGYVPEPDLSAFIDTSDNTFALGDFAAATVTAANLVATTGVTFADNTVQTSAGVPSLTGFTEKTASYTLDTLDHQDNVVEMNSGSAMTFTIPTNSSLAWPVGASMDIIQTGSGQVTISPDSGVTLNYTPGNKLRTQWSSCTIMKRATDSWIVYGDLTA
jgi:hypothetical protein